MRLGEAVWARLRAELKGAEERLAASSALLGFDAFIDIVAQPIRGGSAQHGALHFDHMSEFGAFVAGRAGLSGSVELHERSTKMGGNAPNVARALGELGVTTHCAIPAGAPEVLFQPLAEHGRIYSTGEPGLCVALEFVDGKLMLGVNRSVNLLTWAEVRDCVGLDRLVALADACGVICFLNWGEMPGSTGILEGLMLEVLPKVSGERDMLIDLCDCARRSEGELHAFLTLLSELPSTVRPVLSLNANEQSMVRRVLGISDTVNDVDAARAIRERLNLRRVVFHRRGECRIADPSGDCALPTPRVIERPAILTGAGDAFNAGLCAAFLLGLDGELCMALASSVAGYYVEFGTPPALGELAAYIDALT